MQAGLSLIELMIGIALGLVLMTGLLIYFTTSLSTNRFAYQNSRLNQELNAVMEMMVRDIRRAGYWGAAQDGIGNPTAYSANAFISNIGTNDGGIDTSTAGCILYKYDRNDDGTLQDNEKMGFRISSNQVEIRSAGSGHECGSTSNTWEAITDANTIKIDSLTFNKTHISTDLSTGKACTRNIEIKLTGSLISDALASQTLTQSVRIRTDWYLATGNCP